MEVAYKQRLFTVEEYYTMAEAGILTEDDRVELIDGHILAMSPIGSRHAGCVNRLNQLLSEAAGRRVLVSVQNPIRLSKHSEPEPDIALLRPRADYYTETHPGPEDVLLVIEVVESSAESDRRIKVPLYARYGIPEVWLVVPNTEVVEIYRQPSSGRYLESHRLGRGQVLNIGTLPEITLSVQDIFG